MPAGLDAIAGGLETDQAHARIIDESMEDADRVGTATDAGGHSVRQAARLLQDLRPRLQSDDALEIADHRRERMRAGCGAEAVVGVVGVGHPVAERLVDGVFQRLRTGLDRHHFGAEQPHPGDVSACRAVSTAPM